ncbi:hypothetical protein [[Clostridium] fimetarium]|uniref:Apea-like HEPN domain-containing protein n=1 Tax=[Clostridium] fimetarium TaxID=99656 RepID=A0A1I0MX98_9FIRM|nr:hypothetical protein [[Clostridium] fimetarium]SEV93384.1 hypothetical protein SAMN05421659_102223 [[Clostridium] fimetarium]
MPKKLRNEPIYLASEILGFRDANYNPVITDERTGKRLDPNDIDDKIFIYKRQVDEWFLSRAVSLCSEKNNSFVVVMIATSYIEGVEQYRHGGLSNRKSKEYFLEGMRRIFRVQNVTDDQLSVLYKQLRCGLFHNGMSGDAVVLSHRFKINIEFSNRGTIDINPQLFLSDIIQDFEQYINDLTNLENTIMRNNFDCMFSVL